MVLKVWHNLLKFMFMRWSIQFGETLQSAYALCVRVLRKLNRRVIRFSWLQRAINRLLPCPQMVQRYIDPAIGLEEFFTILNQRGIRYTILRGFEKFPFLTKDDDVDMLVHDDDLPKIKDLFVALPTGISCDIYSVSPLHGASYRKGVPLYPSHLAREILDTSVLYKEAYRVPDTKHYFLSLAYHAVYHKAEASGLPNSKDKPLAKVDGQRSYGEKLVVLGEACGINLSPDLRSLHELLTESGWAPRMDVLRIIAKGSRWLTSLADENSGGQPFSSKTMRYQLDIHGLRVLVESNCATFLEYIRRDFCFFHDPNEDQAPPHVRISFLNTPPPWEEIPRHAVPLFKTVGVTLHTVGSTVYKRGSNRYVDHDREVFTVYDLKRDEGTVYGSDPEALYRSAYSILMTRIGCRFDQARYHRMHSLGITLKEEGLLFLADGGCGKTTLGLEMMKRPEVGWLTDDILQIDPRGNALAFPTSPRFVQGSMIPWLPASANLVRAPMPKHPQKVQLDASFILPRVCPSARVGALFLCRRKSGVGPFIRRLGFLEAFLGICDGTLSGRGFGVAKAYDLQFSLPYICRLAAVYFSRVRLSFRLAWTVPAFRFDMGGQVSGNAELVLKIHDALRHKGVRSLANPIGVSSFVSRPVGRGSDKKIPR